MTGHIRTTTRNANPHSLYDSTLKPKWISFVGSSASLPVFRTTKISTADASKAKSLERDLPMLLSYANTGEELESICRQFKAGRARLQSTTELEKLRGDTKQQIDMLCKPFENPKNQIGELFPAVKKLCDAAKQMVDAMPGTNLQPQFDAYRYHVVEMLCSLFTLKKSPYWREDHKKIGSYGNAKTDDYFAIDRVAIMRADKITDVKQRDAAMALILKAYINCGNISAAIDMVAFFDFDSNDAKFHREVLNEQELLQALLEPKSGMKKHAQRLVKQSDCTKTKAAYLEYIMGSKAFHKDPEAVLSECLNRRILSISDIANCINDGLLSAKQTNQLKLADKQNKALLEAIGLKWLAPINRNQGLYMRT